MEHHILLLLSGSDSRLTVLSMLHKATLICESITATELVKIIEL